MAVLVNREVAATGLYVPYHQAGRDASNALVGSLAVNAEATGDSGGGNVTIQLLMLRSEFGFPQLWVPTLIAAQDNLGTAEPVVFNYLSSGNRRLNANIAEVITMIDGGGTSDFGHVENVSLPLEVDPGSDRSVLSMKWSTNTDGKIYHMHVVGPVYDLQMLAKDGYIDEMMAGLR